MALLDPVIHPPARLQLCAMLSAVERAEFALVRDRLGVSDSVLSKHAGRLVEAGYIAIGKEFGGHRRTWLSLTRTGREAFEGHVAALQALAEPDPDFTPATTTAAPSGALRQRPA